MNFRPVNRSCTARPRTAQFRIAALLLATAVLVTSATPAVASTETLRRSVSNISQAPLDWLFSPFVGIYSVITRMREQEDPTAVRVVFFLPGVIWNTGVNIGGGRFASLQAGLSLFRASSSFRSRQTSTLFMRRSPTPPRCSKWRRPAASMSNLASTTPPPSTSSSLFWLAEGLTGHGRI